MSASGGGKTQNGSPLRASDGDLNLIIEVDDSKSGCPSWLWLLLVLVLLMAGGLTWFIISRQSRSAADSWNCTKCKQSIPGTQPSGVTLCKKCRQTNSESWNCTKCKQSIPGTQPSGVTLCKKCRQ